MARVSAICSEPPDAGQACSGHAGGVRLLRALWVWDGFKGLRGFVEVGGVSEFDGCYIVAGGCRFGVHLLTWVAF